MVEGIENGKCPQHSGVRTELDHLTDSDRRQWCAIDGIRRTLTSTLTAVIITLLVGIVNLAIILARGGQ